MFNRLKERAKGPDGAVDFLRDDYVAEAGAAIGLPEEIVGAMRAGAAAIRDDGASAETARTLYRELFVDALPPGPVNERLLASGPYAGMMAALVYLGALPPLIERYESRRIPERVLVMTMEDMTIWMRRHRELHGEWGLSQLGWLIKHWTGSLFRLGRLQFTFMAYDKPFRAFRSRSTGQVAVLCEAGVRYRADGQVDGTNGTYDPNGGWVSSYAFDGAVHTGSPVSPAGAAVRTPIALDGAEWEPALERGDVVLDVHIPEGGKMSRDLCRESYGQAIAFAAEHFPEKPFRAFVCASWLLAPQFPGLLPPDSNIVRFQSDYFITPILSDEEQTLERVYGFGTKLADLPRVPRDSSLQRIVYDHLTAGGAIHGAAGLLLRDDWERGTARAPIG
ncbi:acyltransferase domain-containing protein [Paenibacillus flagellatus]|uniref:GNAT-like C-terminal domain-containing protein n=1 Tax=Paenibacillus flagellatus TaxID=2211139 RepID=A0A2V5K117_9BACL|nr:acyltransferase domain-containing protein [Paenibacillus flagellatus]PYI51414.1 hypothetical protein DLM86_25710 [Paenibacillus flagellatus]